MYPSLLTSIVSNSVYNRNTCLNNFLSLFCDDSVILWSHWCSLFQNSVDSAYGFQSEWIHNCLHSLLLTCNAFSESTLARPGLESQNLSHVSTMSYPPGHASQLCLFLSKFLDAFCTRAGNLFLVSLSVSVYVCVCVCFCLSVCSGFNFLHTFECQGQGHILKNATLATCTSV